jgi:hypothetical protein
MSAKSFFSPGSAIVMAMLGFATAVSAASPGPFVIRVVDEATSRGVPLVELKSVNNAAWWTDSAGIVAFDEPGLMGQEVYFHVSSPGYEYPKDFFGNRGLKLRPAAGKGTEIKLKRINIAERLYRITGQGIYRDSLLAGLAVPLREPVFNGQVMGQDTVIATPYRGKIYWFYGDTERASYPLGNFGASGATSELTDRGGLDADVGVDLTYFVDTNGFSKPMCPVPGEGLRWIESLFTLPDETGTERLVARMANHRDLGHVLGWHLLLFDDAKAAFEPLVHWDIRNSHDSAHPFRAKADGKDYIHLYPEWRVHAELAAVRDLTQYEAFTCVAGDGKLGGGETRIERDASGRAVYAWKKGADRLNGGRLAELRSGGKLQREEAWWQLRDVETGAPVEGGRGSVCWNEYRGRWVAITSGRAGEIWFSEADTPTGPWVYARRIAVHGRYNFYNPTQHPFFDQEGGRRIYFEGTYTASFSGAPVKTPRYDYNQMMYRLALDDPRLALPAPVYRVRKAGGSWKYAMREAIVAGEGGNRIEEIAFFALPPARPRDKRVAVYYLAEENRLTTEPAGEPLFLALPETDDAKSDDGTVPMATLLKSAQPRCRVWRNPMTTLTFDFGTRP